MSIQVFDKRFFRPLIILAVVLFFIGTALSLTLLFLPSGDYFQYYLSRSDTALKHKDYESLKRLLDKASRHAKTRMNWYSLFKRSYMAARERNDYHDFQALVSRSSRFFRGDQDLEAINTAALLWTRKYEKAAASLYAIQNKRYESLIAETLLSWDVFRKYDLEGRAPLDFIKQKILYQEDPAFFQSVGEKAGNPELLYNAALLSMREQDYDRSSSILAELPAGQIDPYRLGILYYDLGNFESALKAFKAQIMLDEVKGNERSSIYQICGDLSRKGIGSDKAFDYYRKAVKLDAGGGQWKNYRNLGRIFLDEGRSRKARAILRAGMTLYPDKLELLGDYVASFRKETPLESRELLQEYIDRHPDSSAAQLLMIRYFPPGGTAVQYQARLWKLFNKDAGNEDVTRFLLWYLAGVEDLKSMGIVLERFEEAYARAHFEGENSSLELPFWYGFYISFMALKDQLFKEALVSMKKAYEQCPKWYMAYNLGILQRIAGNNSVAEHLFEKAAQALLSRDTVTGAGGWLSGIFYEQAVSYLDHEDYEKALEALEKAISHDPHNLRAETLLNRIQ